MAFATGYFGSSAARFFPDRDLFGDLWVAPYFATSGCCNFVAEEEEEVVGYIVGSCDTAAYRRSVARHAARCGVRWLGGRYRNAAGSLRYLLRAAWYSGPAAPVRAYPAHLHINLLPRARGKGLGRKLLDAFVRCVRTRGVPGVQLATTIENEAALGLYRAAGFRVWERGDSRLWRPWLGRNTTHVVMVADLSPPRSEGR